MHSRFVLVALVALAGARAEAQETPAAGPAQGAGAPQPGAAAQAAPQGAPAASDEERRKLEEQIAKELGAKGAGSAQAQPAPEGQGAGAPPAGGPPLSQTGGNPYARLLMLPDVSAIGDLALAYDSYDVGRLSPRSDPYGPPGKPTPLFQELELGLQAVIDPYARADVFLSFTPSGAAVEEAYATTLGLPAGLQLKAGEFLSPFGRLNQQHPHVWDFVDAPLAMSRILAADQLSGAGVGVAWLAPLPWFAELHLDYQTTAPDTAGDPSPVATERRVTGMARLVQYFGAGEATTIGVGLSAGLRDEGAGAFRDLGGADLFVKIRPPRTRAYLALQAEAFGRAFRGLSGPSDWGAYAQAFWRQDAYLGYGIRYDRAPAAPESPRGAEQRLSAVASWFLTEFQRLRLQATWDRRPGGRDGLEALLHLEFGIGAHGAHPF